MDAQELYDVFRSEVNDLRRPYLWTDEDIIRYMNEAYNMFVRLTGGINDVTSEATTIDLTTGEDAVALHPSVLRIMDAYNVSDGSEVKIANFTDLPNLFVDPDYKYLRPLFRKNAPGQVRWLIVGEQRDISKVIQIPTADDQIQMTIYRLPLVPITDLSHELDEVKDIHHNSLLHWMKGLAYGKQDSETFDKGKSEEFEGKFQDYCALAKAEWSRYKHKTRVVAYGGL